MTTYYVSGKRNNGYYLACIWYNCGINGTYKGRDETELAEKVAEKLQETGWKLSFAIDNSICFSVLDHDEYEQFVDDFRKVKKQLKEERQ